MSRFATSASGGAVLSISSRRPLKRVFVDTSGFFALYSSNDADHQRAVALFEQADSERWELVTTNAVVLETCALLGWHA